VSLEQLALLAIALFAFMAIVNMFYSVRSIKRASGFKSERVRRLVGGTDCARAVAESVIKEIIAKYPDEAARASQAKKLSSDLEAEVEKARTYYLGRVEAVHKPLFNDAVDKLILKKNL
jgi:predicted Holliday junction resolvase-like endonuclease